MKSTKKLIQHQGKIYVKAEEPPAPKPAYKVYLVNLGFITMFIKASSASSAIAQLRQELSGRAMKSLVGTKPIFIAPGFWRNVETVLARVKGGVVQEEGDDTDNSKI